MKVQIKLRVNEKTDTRIKAYAGLTFDECFVVNGIKVVEGKNGLFVTNPSYKKSDGEYKDIAYPLDKKYRDMLSKAILEKYEKAIANNNENNTYVNFE